MAFLKTLGLWGAAETLIILSERTRLILTLD